MSLAAAMVVADVQGLLLQLQVTGLDFGKIQNVVDHAQQLIAGEFQHAQQFFLGGVQDWIR